MPRTRSMCKDSFPPWLHHLQASCSPDCERYHSAKTLRLMNRYRIGRIAGPWLNLTPPIRGGIYRSAAEEDSSSSDDDSDSHLTSANSSTTSIDVINDVKLDQPHLLDNHLINRWSKVVHPSPVDGIPHWTATNEVGPIGASANSSCRRASTRKPEHKSPEEYTSFAVQNEIDSDLRDYPSLDAETQRGITEKYQALHQRVKDEGFYDCRYIEYGKELIRYSALFALFVVCLRAEWYLTSAAFLGLFWHQIMFTAHDAGHRGITHNFIADTLIGMFIADFCCGLSIGWWKSSHNVHHLVTNHPEHDPDIQNVPLFATSPSFFKSLHSTYYNFTYIWDSFANLAVRYQAYTYYPIMAIARFNLYLLSWLHLLSPRSTNLGSAAWTRPTEIAFMLCYWALFGYCLLWRSLPTWPLRVAFVLVSHIITMPLHVQITLSHWAMPTADLGDGESFPQRQLRTTMDVECPAWLDFVHGGLQFQAVHHLFPRVPRHNLRRLQGLVREFCGETGIEYRCLGFVEGNRQVLGRLGEVAGQVELLVRCQRYMAETGESGLH
ncbi:MAG: fatty acid desaturase [Lasallia pustulata]|uniref:Fatty acid desaturase n=1 Tax=Lasallia pustulata TaxID=136370 RepID=A0A5M8PZ81_9LECA|nr:MAG: fatty acid desaturase [Lasallia pustulata]